MNSLDGAGMLSDQNRMVRGQGSVAITTAAVLGRNISDSTLHCSYAGHPTSLAWRSGGRWLPLVLEMQTGQANLPLGVLDSFRYDQGAAAFSGGPLSDDCP